MRTFLLSLRPDDDRHRLGDHLCEGSLSVFWFEIVADAAEHVNDR
jgi:hypothetical protein